MFELSKAKPKLQFILFAITAAGVVPCGGPKSLPVHHHSADYISFWSFEISEDILRNQKIIGLDSFSDQRLINLAPFGYSLCIDYPVANCKITVILFGFMLSNL